MLTYGSVNAIVITSTERGDEMTYSECTTKKARVAFLKEKLGTDATWALRGMVRIYEYQTAYEKSAQNTTDANGVGFSGADGFILSAFSEKRIAGKNFSEKMMKIVFKNMPKYASQLDKIVQSGAAA